MDILTLELYDVTVSAALRELQRALEEHPALPLRILLDGDGMLHHNIQRFLERKGRIPQLRQEGGRWRIDVGGLASGLTPVAAPAPAPAPVPVPVPAPGSVPPLPAPGPAPAEEPRPILLTRAALGQGGSAAGRRLLLGVLQELDPATPWLCLALDGLDLLEDPQAVRLLEAVHGRGTAVRISRESQLFPIQGCPFEIMEDSHWQRLAGRGGLVIL